MPAPNPTNHEFFLVTLPGLEDLVLQEVRDWSPHLEAKLEHGGVTVLAPLAAGLALNLVLKTPTRILLRVASFTCRDFPKLFKKVSTVSWREWLDPSCTLEVRASTTRSRLKMKKRIEETCLKAWKAAQKKPASAKVATLYVRLSDNVCTLSLDTSGDRLHRRGERTHVGEAPLRETIAAALIQWMAKDAGPQPVELFDPLMGSGTFLLEAARRDQPIEARHFAFENFATSAGEPPRLSAVRPSFARLIGYEIDAATVAAARQNLAATKTLVDLRLQDFFAAEGLAESSSRRWVVSNPPYGERLKVAGPLVEYYAKLFRAVESLIRPERACFILPTKAVKGRLNLPPAWKVAGKRPFSNGGIPVTAFLFKRVGP